jgi:hypothetical protein
LTAARPLVTLTKTEHSSGFYPRQVRPCGIGEEVTGMLKATDNELVTQVGPGTPMGELMARAERNPA